MTSLLLVALIAQEDAPMAQFFPTTPGLKRRYVSESEKVKTDTTEEVMPAVQIAETNAYPVQSFRAGRKLGIVYYRVEGDELRIAAYDPAKPLDPERVVAKCVPSKWHYDGIDSGFRLVFEGESKLGRRKVEGEDRDILTVVIDAKLDEGPFQNTIKQTSVFARGIGLIELKEERRTAKTKSERTVKLTSVEFPKPGGGR